MDTVTLIVLIASYLVLAMQDNLVAYYWAARVGPRKARDLILQDPEYQETRTLLKDLTKDMELLKNTISSQLDQMDLRISAQVDRFGESTRSIVNDVRIPDAEVDRVTRSIQATMRRSLSTPELLEGVDKLLDEKLARLPNPEEDIEAILQDADLSGAEGQQAAYEWLMGKGLPEPYAFRAAEHGPKMIRRIAKAKGWNILELMEGAE